MSVVIEGLSAAASAAYTQAAGTSCDVRILVEQLTLSHSLVSTLEPVQLDGQVNIVGGESDTVARTLQMGFLDPDNELQLDSDSPAEGVGGIDRLLRVHTFLRGGDGTWLGAPCATMRPSVLARNGDTVTVEAQSKEILHLRGVSAYSIAKNTPHVAAIRQILANGGETRFRFPPNTSMRLATSLTVGGADELLQPWKVACRLARSLGMQLYYDATGYACLRRKPTVPAWTLIEQGPGANMLTRPRLTTDLTDIRNRVIVTGRTVATKKSKSRVITNSASTRTLPDSHPFSAVRLAQNGVPWYRTEFYDEPTLRTQGAVDAFARARLTEWSTEKTIIECSALPVWHLMPLDLIEIRPAVGGLYTQRLDTSSIPLGPSETGMTIGYETTVRSATAGRLRGRAA